MRRVVITAFGAVTPAGLGALSNWESAVAGRSGIGFNASLDASAAPWAQPARTKTREATE
jgi:3-oxoacyl-[acyl-carrier-protein] synthase II